MDVQAVFQSPARWGPRQVTKASSIPEKTPTFPTAAGGGRRAADTVPRCLPLGIASLQIDGGIAAFATTVTLVCRQC